MSMLFILVTAWLAVSAVPTQAASPVEISSLQALFDAANGKRWFWRPSSLGYGPRWTFDPAAQQDPCADFSGGLEPQVWQAVQCSATPAECAAPNATCVVTKLGLNFYGLRGSIPSELGLLSALTSLALSTNSLTGTLPTSLGRLSTLKDMEIQFASLTGSIPEELFEATALRSLHLYANDMTGQISTALGRLSALQTLALSQNCLSGSIPRSIDSLRESLHIDLYYNRLTRSIPSSLGKLTKMEYFGAHYNSLTGSLPTSIGGLRAAKVLSVYSNSLSGPIPAELAHLSNLQSLHLDINCLSGSLPSGLGTLSRLVILNAAYNQLSGPIPPSLVAVSTLQEIDLSSNRLSGSLSASIGALPALVALILGDNALSGPIPASVASNGMMVTLSLSLNAFTGTVPRAIGSMSSLQYMGLDGNMLTGTIPPQVGCLDALRFFSVAGNALVGTIPPEVGAMEVLTHLDLSQNHLTGPIPMTVASLEYLDVMYLARNMLSGTVPGESFAKIDALFELDLSDNHLSGPIPLSLLSLSRLDVLLLSENSFSGQLARPVNTSWARCRLDTLDVSMNRLTGALPNEIFFLPTLRNFAASSNCFHGEIPVSICNSTVLSVLVLDGLSSGDCGGSKALGRRRRTVHGRIPSCIYNMTSLSTLHLSDNDLFGELGSLPEKSSLLDISLSRNHLTGTISSTMLQRPLTTLDLSRNRISGGLRDLHVPDGSPGGGVDLKLSVNRLSGDVPGSARNLSSVDILSSNLFKCDTDRRDLPDRDPDRDNVVCASDDLDDALYTFTAVVSIIFGFIGIYVWNRFKSDRSDFAEFTKASRNAFFGTSDSAEPEALLHTLVRICFLTVILVCVIFIPLYAALGDPHSTHRHRYRWRTTAAMLSGAFPAALVLTAWSVVMGVVFVLLRQGSPASLRSIVASSERSSSEAPMWSFGCSVTKIKLLLIILSDAAVVLFINGVYVYASISGTDATLLVGVQLLLAVSTMALNISVRCVLGKYFQSDVQGTGTLYVLLVVYIFNSVIAPCVASMCTDSACFRDVFVQSNDISASYNIEKCDNFIIFSSGQRACLQAHPVEYTVTYTPGFVYNYQCGSSTLQSFAPVLLFSATLSCLSSMAAIAATYTGAIQRLKVCWSQLSGLSEQRGSAATTRDALALVLARVTVILSFGVACPYISVAMGTSVLLLWAKEIQSAAHVTEGDDELLAAATASLMRHQMRSFSLVRVWLTISTVCAVVLGMFLMDMAADDEIGTDLLVLYPICAVVLVAVLYAAEVLFPSRVAESAVPAAFSSEGMESKCGTTGAWDIELATSATRTPGGAGTGETGD